MSWLFWIVWYLTLVAVVCAALAWYVSRRPFGISQTRGLGEGLVSVALFAGFGAIVLTRAGARES